MVVFIIIFLPLVAACAFLTSIYNDKVELKRITNTFRTLSAMTTGKWEGPAEFFMPEIKTPESYSVKGVKPVKASTRTAGVIRGNGLEDFGLSAMTCVYYRDVIDLWDVDNLIGEIVVLDGADDRIDKLDPFSRNDYEFHGHLVRKCIGVITELHNEREGAGEAFAAAFTEYARKFSASADKYPMDEGQIAKTVRDALEAYPDEYRFVVTVMSNFVYSNRMTWFFEVFPSRNLKGVVEYAIPYVRTKN